MERLQIMTCPAYAEPLGEKETSRHGPKPVVGKSGETSDSVSELQDSRDQNTDARPIGLQPVLLSLLGKADQDELTAEAAASAKEFRKKKR